MKTITTLEFNPKFDKQFFWKDCSIKFLKRNLDPQVVAEIERITQLGINSPRKHITYDIGYQEFKAGTQSCRNTGWHLDGINNEYLMFIVGDFRTEFTDSIDVISLPEDRDKLLEFNSSIATADVAAGKALEIPNATLIKYDSSTVHRGRVADKAGARFFLRVCNSDYLVPKNKRLM